MLLAVRLVKGDWCVSIRLLFWSVFCQFRVCETWCCRTDWSSNLSVWVGFLYSPRSPCDHSRKRPALVTTTFVEPHLKCHSNSLNPDRAFFRSSGARFSKAPKTFRACEAIFNCLYLENKEACRHKTLHEGQLYLC